MTVRSGLRLFVERDPPPVTVVASANDEVTVNVLELICRTCHRQRLLTIHLDSSLTTRARVVAAVDDLVATIP